MHRHQSKLQPVRLEQPEQLHRRDGLPRRPGDPQLLDLRAQVRAPGPHVRAQRLLEPARAPVPGLGVVGVLHQPIPAVLMHQRAPEPEPARLAPRPDPALRLDRHDLSPAPVRRQLGLLRVQGHRARLRGRQRDKLRSGGAGAQDARYLEPAAALHRRPPGRPARECPDAEQLLHRRQGGNAARRVLDRPQRQGLRAPDRAGQRRPDLRDRPSQRDHAQPGLEQHGDLPLLG